MVDVETLDAWMTQAREHDDPDAYAQIVESTHHLIRGTMLRDTANEELSDELAQDTLVQAWAKRKQYRPGTSPRAWLLAIARSKLMEYYRRQDRDRRHMHELIRKELLRHDTGKEEHQIDRLEALQACLRDITDEQRELLDLIHGKGLSTEEAANVLEINPPTCRQRISRLQRKLRACAEHRLKKMHE